MGKRASVTMSQRPYSGPKSRPGKDGDRGGGRGRKQFTVWAISMAKTVFFSEPDFLNYLNILKMPPCRNIGYELYSFF